MEDIAKEKIYITLVANTTLRDQNDHGYENDNKPQ